MKSRKSKVIIFNTFVIGVLLGFLFSYLQFQRYTLPEEPLMGPDIIVSVPEEEEEEEEIVEVEPAIQINKLYAIMLAKLMYGEARGIKSITEQACVAWTVLNRVDAGFGDFVTVITAPNQFFYRAHFPTVDDYGRDLVLLAEDILLRWEREKLGEEDVGRVLPPDYFWYFGDGEHNWFRNEFNGKYTIWKYTLPTPYGI